MPWRHKSRDIEYLCFITHVRRVRRETHKAVQLQNQRRKYFSETPSNGLFLSTYDTENHMTSSNWIQFGFLLELFLSGQNNQSYRHNGSYCRFDLITVTLFISSSYRAPLPFSQAFQQTPLNAFCRLLFFFY